MTKPQIYELDDCKGAQDGNPENIRLDLSMRLYGFHMGETEVAAEGVGAVCSDQPVPCPRGEEEPAGV